MYLVSTNINLPINYAFPQLNTNTSISMHSVNQCHHENKYLRLVESYTKCQIFLDFHLDLLLHDKNTNLLLVIIVV